jgi:hypothetical protein
MTKEELLAKIQEICPTAILVTTEDGGEELCIATGLVEYGEGEELISVEDYNPKPTNEAEQESYYFAEDGNYGEADKLVVIETSKWNEDDWQEIDDTPDWDRPRVAKIINNKYKKN